MRRMREKTIDFIALWLLVFMNRENNIPPPDKTYQPKAAAKNEICGGFGLNVFEIKNYFL